MVGLQDVLKQYIHGGQRACVRSFLQHPLMIALDRAWLEPQQLKALCAARFTAVSKFEALLERARDLAIRQGMNELGAELHMNLCDERGIGRAFGQGAHKEWRKDFLDALHIRHEGGRSVPQLYNFTANDSLAILCGMILAAEYTIPPEDKRILKSLRLRFPDIFTPADKALPATPEQERATRYLYDHIHHDAESHFPDLMRAMNRTVGIGGNREIISGISRFTDERNALYDVIQQALGFTYEKGTIEPSP